MNFKFLFVLFVFLNAGCSVQKYWGDHIRNKTLVDVFDPTKKYIVTPTLNITEDFHEVVYYFQNELSDSAAVYRGAFSGEYYGIRILNDTELYITEPQRLSILVDIEKVTLFATIAN